MDTVYWLLNGSYPSRGSMKGLYTDEKSTSEQCRNIMVLNTLKLVYVLITVLLLVSRILLFEDREERYHWKRLLSGLRVFKTVPAMQVFYI